MDLIDPFLSSCVVGLLGCAILSISGCDSSPKRSPEHSADADFCFFFGKRSRRAEPDLFAGWSIAVGISYPSFLCSVLLMILFHKDFNVERCGGKGSLNERNAEKPWPKSSQQHKTQIFFFSISPKSKEL